MGGMNREQKILLYIRNRIAFGKNEISLTKILEHYSYKNALRSGGVVICDAELRQLVETTPGMEIVGNFVRKP